MRKNWKIILLAAVVLTAMCISDGCGSGEPDGTGEQKTAETAPVQPVAEDQAEAPNSDDGEKPEEEDERSTDDGTDAETFCGNVERIDGDSVVCSRIETYKTESGQGEVAVATTAEEDKELVTIRFAQDAVYTYQIIRDGGADVETREGSFADIKAGLLLDLTGHYDGDVFWADTVRISDVRND